MANLKRCAQCGVCLFLVFLAIGIFGVTLFNQVLSKQVLSQVVMGPANYELWGQIPGQLGANVTRWYSFFNFMNPFETLFFNATPQFVQLPSQNYQEFQNFTNPEFLDFDDQGNFNLVKYGFWGYVVEYNLEANQTATTVNLGGLGFWYNAKNAPKYQLAVNVLANLIISMNQQIVPSAYSTGVHFLLIPNYEAFSGYFSQYVTNQTILKWIWEDPVMGMSNLENQLTWVQVFLGSYINGTNAAYETGAAKIIQDYFSLTNEELLGMIDPGNSFVKQFTTIEDALVIYGCPNNECNGEYLSALQWSTQNVTSTPPAKGIPGEPSIASTNSTISGYPEISYYMSQFFFPTYQVNSSFNVTFSINLTLQLLNYTPSAPSIYCTNQNTLLHQGNMEFFYQQGELWNYNFEDLTALQPIVERFGLPSLQHAAVLFSYVDYLEQYVGEQVNINGTTETLVIGNLVSEAIYQEVSAMGAYLLVDMLARMIRVNITTQGYNCPEYFILSGGVSAPNAEKICQLENFEQFNRDSIKFLIYMCRRPNDTNWRTFKEQTGFSNNEMVTLCQNEAQYSFGATWVWANLELHDVYTCTTYSPYCSDYEFAIRQWASSNITSTVPPTLNGELTPSSSISDWNNTLFPTVFEWMPVITLLSPNFNPEDIQPLSYEQALNLLSFNALLNPVVAGDAFIFAASPDLAQNYSTTFFGVNPWVFNTYLRYIAIEIGLNGFAQTRNTEDLLWGYTDPFLQQISTTNPLLGGDPALSPLISLAGGNSSYEIAQQTPYTMYTGANDSTLLRLYYTVYDTDIIVINQSFFNGNETYQKFINPWRANITIYGTDGVMDKPAITENYEVPIFINSLYFQANTTFQGEIITYDEIPTYRYKMPFSAMANKEHNPANNQWLADRWDGVLNFSTCQQAPVFFTKGHFLNVTPEVANAVEMYWDMNMTELIVPSIADDIYIDIEPITGATMSSMIRLQLSYEFKQDTLFNTETYAFLPLFLLNRGSNITDEQIEANFGQLQIAVVTMQWMPWVGFSLAGVMSILVTICFCKMRTNSRTLNVQHSLDESLHQPMIPNNNDQSIDNHAWRNSVHEEGSDPERQN